MQVLLEGLTFPEGPRWRDGHLWFSDLRRRTVNRVGLDGSAEIVLAMEDAPSGLGFLADGVPLVVSMRDRLLLRIVGQRTEIHADLRDYPGDFLNDMVVDETGRAYVGLRSAQLYPGLDLASVDATDALIVVEPDGQAHVAAGGLIAPNGVVISPDGAFLILAETYAHRLTIFDRGVDGSLSNRRLFAAVEGRFPDGICLDEDGAVWYASPYTSEAVRVREGGRVTDCLALPGAVACALGGPGRSVLFVLGVDRRALPPVGRPGGRPGTSDETKLHDGRIWTIPVGCAGAGWP
jgi:sugar lactone lactonase YvrE